LTLGRKEEKNKYVPLIYIYIEIFSFWRKNMMIIIAFSREEVEKNSVEKGGKSHLPDFNKRRLCMHDPSH